jgi:hypothetical protein
MITNEQLVQHFWQNANLITTNEGVEVALHAECLIEVSVLLRNHEQYEVRLQLRVAFNTVPKFLETFKLKDLEDIQWIGLEDLLLLYKAGKAELSVVEFPA